MVTSKIKELAALKAKIATMEQQVSLERAKALAALPVDFGFESTEAFISAVREATGSRRGGKSAGAKPQNGSKPDRRRRRAKITDETRAEVKRLVGAGKTGAEIAKAVGISLPSVQNIKKALGLVAARKKK